MQHIISNSSKDPTWCWMCCCGWCCCKVWNGCVWSYNTQKRGSWNISVGGGEDCTHTHVNVEEKTSTLDLPTSVRASDQTDGLIDERGRSRRVTRISAHVLCTHGTRTTQRNGKQLTKHVDGSIKNSRRRKGTGTAKCSLVIALDP